MPSPALEEFKLGWICALPIEAAAAKQMLNENFGILIKHHSADTNSYIHFGSDRRGLCCDYLPPRRVI
jgi:hypothetical protein